MNPKILLASTLWLLFPPQYPGHNAPLRNTFVVATETVIDTASSIDLTANHATSDEQMQHLKTIAANLASMANDDQEKQVVDTVHDMTFAITACSLQARQGAPTAQCQSQFDSARRRVMQAIGKHKDGSAWVDGPPPVQ